ncbi:ribosome-associated translation inhibitor RaiA [Prolixibacteraceae bacterium JC049]|nr:ribosome-associated translation inhibitor RaiA [Prolixibacteraceae bacterium JC049]
MNVKVNPVHFKADQKLTEFVNKKAQKLEQYFDGLISVEVTLKIDKPESPKNKVAELRLSVPSHDNLFAEKQADTFEEATDLVLEAGVKQLKKMKEKLKAK